jgi:UPF0755 protein
MLSSIFKKMFIVVVVLICLIGGKFYYFLNSSSASDDAKITFNVLNGQGVNAITRGLRKDNFVSSTTLFKLYVYLAGGEKLFKAGEYELSKSMTPAQIYDILVSGKSKEYNFTVPEGYNIHQIADLIEQKGYGTKEEFIELVKSPKFIEELNLQGRSLEGYLFPSTYKFPRIVNMRRIVSNMVKKFKEVYKPEYAKRAEEIGFTKHQVVTLASIVEKETGAARERSLIASVFHNRLKKRMRLESDPTVIYGIENFNGNLRRKHLQTVTPYNTYKIFGLPEGPISNPGEDAIKGVLWPDKSKYLFFVSRNDGTHVFTTNFKDHQREVYKWQKLRRNRVGKSWRDLKKKKSR